MMRVKSAIYCYVFGGLILIGAVSTAATLIDDHSVSYFDKCAKKIDKSFDFCLVKMFSHSKMKETMRNS